MRKITTKRTFIIAIIFVAVIAACSKDFDKVVIDSFEFSIEEVHDESIFVFEPSKTDFSITPERMVSSVTYYMKYNVTDGQGYFLDSEMDTIPQNDTISLSNLDFSYNYIAMDTIPHKVKIQAWDSNERSKELELIYNPKFAGFNFLLTKGTEDLIINSNNPINASLIRDLETSGNLGIEPNQFEVTYQIENGSGQLLHNGEPREQGSGFNLFSGNTELIYQPETLGEHILTMTATAADGAKITRTMVLVVENLNFTFRSTAGSTQVELNSNLPINIDLQTQEEENQVTYEITHSFSSDSQGSGTVRDQNGGVMNPGTNRRIVPGNYNYTFTGDDLGQRKIYFDITDSNGQVKRDSVEIEVANIPFTFSGNAESNQVFVNQRTQLNFNTRSNGNTSNINYSLTYNIIEGNGTLTGVNGNNIQNNTDYPIDLGNFSLFYTPESLENHVIEFFVTDNFGQSVGPVVIDLTARNLDIDFNASAGSNDVLVGQRAPIALNLIEKGDYNGVTYEMSYFITGGPADLYNGNSPIRQSQFFTVIPGSFSYDFIGNAPGTYEITFLLRDSNGQQLPEEKVTVVVGNNDFAITMTPQKSTEFTNLPVNVIVDIVEIPVGTGDSYEAFFSSSKNGEIQVSGASYGPGEKFTLIPGVNIISYTGLESGNHSIVLSVKSGSDVTRTSETQINFNQVDFTFTGGSQSSSISIGETTALNFNISETVGNSNYTLRFSITGSGNVLDANGTRVSPGNIYDVPKGNFSWSFEGTDETSVSMVFFARNETGLEKQVPISINVVPKEFEFTLSAVNSQTNTGEDLPINFNISEIGVGGDTYTMSYSTGSNNGTFVYEGQEFAAGESFNVPVGSFQGVYTGLTEGSHSVTFTVRSSSNVTKDGTINLGFEDYEEPFVVTVSQASGIRLERVPFNLAVIVDAIGTHRQGVTYSMKFSFSGNRAGYILYAGTRYDEGQNVPLEYGSSNMTFYPETQETFTINFDAENSTGETSSTETFVDTIRKPVAQVKGEKHNVNCGGLNGCDYQVRIYTCFNIGCSEAYSGATLDQVEIRIYNRKTNRWETKLFNYNEASGNGVDRYFLLEEEPRESRLRYLDQDFEVRVRDTNNQWGDRVSGQVIRV